MMQQGSTDVIIKIPFKYNKGSIFPVGIEDVMPNELQPHMTVDEWVVFCSQLEAELEVKGKKGDSMKSEGANSKWCALSVAVLVCVTFFASTVTFISMSTKVEGFKEFFIGISIIVAGIVACCCICLFPSEQSLDASKLVCSGIEEILKEANADHENRIEFTLKGKYIGKRQIDNFIQCQIRGEDP